MSVVQYVGARYVPWFFVNPDDGTDNWKAAINYEPLTVVYDTDSYYISKIPVPAEVGRPALNSAYWINAGLYSKLDAEQYINDWLDTHPEATTTVLPESITSEKFKQTSVPFYNVADYGILPNSGDIYADLYELLSEKVYLTGGIVYFPAGTYTTSYTIFIPENTTFIGEGEDTEIYFDETDTEFGVCLANAGSNVTIKNLKVSQASTGTFSSGSQPGCIGFSDIAKETAIAGAYSHTFTRGEVFNLKAENVYFSGFYPIQTENATYTIHNVEYKNLYGAGGCISIQSSTKISNIIIENITCDLFRITVNNSGINENVYCRNVLCNKFVFTNPSSDENIVVENLIQSNQNRNNDFYPTFSAVINGNISFSDCTFQATSDEVGGIGAYTGIRRFNNCLFNMKDRIITRNNPLSDTTNYEIVNNCTFNSTDHSTSNVMIGYGANNIVNASNLNALIWGDMHRILHDTIGIDGASAAFPNTLEVDDSTVMLLGYGQFSSASELFTLGARLLALPFNDLVPITVWNSSDREGSTVKTFATVVNDKLSIADPAYADSTSLNRFIIEHKIQLTRNPTPSEIFTAFN